MSVGLVDEKQRDDAFWMVASELTGEGLSREVLEGLHRLFVEGYETEDRRLAVKRMHEHLSGIDWDWPRLYQHQKLHGYGTVADVRKFVESHTAKDLMEFRCSKPELLNLCKHFDIQVKPSLTKPLLVDALAPVARVKLKAALRPVTERFLEKELSRCREKMVLAFYSRITNVILGAFRHRQLLEPGLADYLPYLQFICHAEPTKECRALNKKVLPVQEALKVFPSLPCDNLACNCSINMARTLKGNSY